MHRERTYTKQFTLLCICALAVQLPQRTLGAFMSPQRIMQHNRNNYKTNIGLVFSMFCISLGRWLCIVDVPCVIPASLLRKRVVVFESVLSFFKKHFTTGDVVLRCVVEYVTNLCWIANKQTNTLTTSWFSDKGLRETKLVRLCGPQQYSLLKYI